MARQEKYTQCKLRRPLRAERKREPGSWLEHGILHDPDNTIYEVVVSWIPSDIAKKGNPVRLKEFGSDEWSEGWTVLEVWGTKAGDQVEAAVPDHKHQRAQSDV
jgi:hypothetical protein